MFKKFLFFFWFYSIKVGNERYCCYLDSLNWVTKDYQKCWIMIEIKKRIGRRRKYLDAFDAGDWNVVCKDKSWNLTKWFDEVNGPKIYQKSPIESGFFVFMQLKLEAWNLKPKTKYLTWIKAIKSRYLQTKILNKKFDFLR